MAAGGTLGDYYVTFLSKGKAQLNDDIDAIGKSLLRADAEGGRATSSLASRIADVGTSLKRIAEGAATTAAGFTGKLAGVGTAFAGLSDSALASLQALETGPAAAGKALEKLGGNVSGIARALSTDFKAAGLEATSALIAGAGKAAQAVAAMGPAGAPALAQLAAGLNAVAVSAKNDLGGLSVALQQLQAGLAAAGKAGGGTRAGSPVSAPLRAVAAGADATLGRLAAPISIPLKVAAVGVDAAFAGLGKALAGAQAMFSRFTAGLQAVGQAAAVPFVIASAAGGGWVRAGLSGTTMGERLGLQFSLLSREVASLFIPALQKLTEVLQSITGWFRSLDGPTQRMIGNTIAIGIAVLGVAAVLPRLISGFQAIGAVFSVLSANPLVAILGVIAALAVATEGGRSALGRLAEAFAPIISVAARLLEALKPVFDFLGDVGVVIVNAISAAVRAIVEGIRWLINLGRGIAGLEELASPYTGTQSGSGEGSNRQELQNSGGRRESSADAFNRFQSAALRTSANEPPTQGQMQRALDLLTQMVTGVAAPAPPPVS